MSNKSSNEFIGVDSFSEETMPEDYDMESSSEVLNQELEEGEVLQDAELVCVNQEDMERIDAAAEEAADNEFSSPNYSQQKAKRKGQDLLRYHIVSCQEELEELRNQSANEDILIDPKEKLHLVKYVKIEGRILKLWECGICAKDFRHQYTLMRHLPTHTDERKFVCDVCDKAFRQMSTLSQHRAIHSDARPYVCEVCQKTFNRVSTLISHRRTHFDDKPHKCHVCGKGFHQKGNLKNHLFSHSNERPYRCEICGRGFNQMSNLVVHKMKLHGQASLAEGSTAQSGKFSCKLCDDKFPKKTLLTLHEEQVHNLIKPRSSSSRNRIRVPPSNRKPVQVALASGSVTTKSSSVNKSSSKAVQSKNENGSTAGLLIDSIQTPSMLEARNTNQTAFALLKSIDGTPSLVKIFDLPNNKQLLISATSEDLAESAQKSAQVDPSCKPSQVKVAVVATVSQHMDEDGQLVVRIESIDVDQKVLDSIETPCRQENVIEMPSLKNEVVNSYGLTSDLENEQVHFVRPLPDGGFEIVAGAEATSFLEIVEEDSSRSGDASNNSNLMDSAQIIITQDEDGHLMLEGSPLQYLLGTNNQQPLQFVLNNSMRK